MTQFLYFFTILGIIIISKPQTAVSQVSINNDGTLPDNSAILEVKSNTKGFLPPRMTMAEMYAIPNPAQGLMVFCTDCSSMGAITFFMNGEWNTLAIGCALPTSPVSGVSTPYVNQIQWNWNAVPGAIGYKWNSVNNYSTAMDMGTNTSTIQSGLSCNTLYNSFVWAYKGCGTSSSTLLTQTTSPCGSSPPPCPGIPTVYYAGHSYNTVQIGSQCWFRENLNVGTRLDMGQQQTNNLSVEKYCYNDDENNCSTFGGLYQWAEIVKYLNGATNNTSWNPVPTGNIQGICPVNWHIPSSDEFTGLIDYFGGQSVAGGSLKESGNVHWNAPNIGATNSSGFTGLGGGWKWNGGPYDYLKYEGDFWASTEAAQSFADHLMLFNNYQALQFGGVVKSIGNSVRCIHD